jgi:hypothetical protein
VNRRLPENHRKSTPHPIDNIGSEEELNLDVHFVARTMIEAAASA